MMENSAHELNLRKILLVEDSRVAARQVDAVFCEDGSVDIIHVETLERAIELLRGGAASMVDVVLLDLTLPDSSGLETLRRFRRENSHLPLVVLTGTNDEATGLNALREGAQDFLIKDETFPKLMRRTVHFALLRKHREEDLVSAKERAEEATRLKDKFVSLVAHDLRGPLGAITGLVELMYTYNDPPVPEKHRERLKYIIDGGQTLLKVVEELLDISRLQSGKIKPEPVFFDAHYLADEGIARLIVPASEKSLGLINDVPQNTRIYADRVLLGQVLQNLISNAIKFSHPGGEIRVFVPEGDPMTLAVRDDGVGIPQKIQDKLFRIEEKVSTVGTSGERGTGFGLPLSRNIMLAHDGDILVASEPDRGSTFLAHLPEVKPRVLVVDDEPMFRTILSMHLKSIGAEVVLAENGLEAMDLVHKEGGFHLILSDIVMPGMDGFGVLDAVRKLPGPELIPVIVVTGDDKISTREKALGMGAADFTVKPIVPHEFIPRVRRIIG